MTSRTIFSPTLD